MKITTWNNLLDTLGTPKDATWEQLAKWFARPVAFTGTETTKGWSAASFTENQRRKDHAIEASALCLDFDGTATREELTELFAGAKYLAHSSKSNTADTPRYRVVLAISRVVTPEEYELLWSGYNRELLDRVDVAAKDISRFWFVPCKTADTKYETWACDGVVVNVETVLNVELAMRDRELRDAQAKAREDREKHVRLQASSDGNGLTKESRAERYMATMEPSIAGQGGDAQLWRVACALVKGFDLDSGTALSMLEEFNTRCLPPWPAKHLRHKVGQAEKARLDAGYLLSQGDDLSPVHTPELPPDPPYEEKTDTCVSEPCGASDCIDSRIEPGEYAYLDNPECAPITTEHEVETVATAPAPVKPILASVRLGVKSLKDLALDVMTDARKPKDRAKCITGVGKLDADMGGMRASMITVLAARTSFGKTTFGLTATDATLKQGMNVLWLPFEDSTLLYGRRIVAARAGINALALRDGDLSYKEWQRMAQVASEATDTPFILSCIGKSVEWACKSLVELSHEMKIHLVVMDYVQRMHTEKRTQDRRSEVTMAAEIASDTIKGVGAAGLLISQIKRLKPGERPTMFDLKESGDLENCAEHIILGWSEEESQPARMGEESKRIITRRIFLEKNKDGPLTGEDIEVPFDEVSACFRPNEPQFDEAPPAGWREMNDDIDGALGAC